MQLHHQDTLMAGDESLMFLLRIHKRKAVQVSNRLTSHLCPWLQKHRDAVWNVHQNRMKCNLMVHKMLNPALTLLLNAACFITNRDTITCSPVGDSNQVFLEHFTTFPVFCCPCLDLFETRCWHQIQTACQNVKSKAQKASNQSGKGKFKENTKEKYRTEDKPEEAGGGERQTEEDHREHRREAEHWEHRWAGSRMWQQD